MFLTHTANLLYDGLLALVYPQQCAVCNGSVEKRQLGSACATCWNATRTFGSADVVCWKCGALSIGTIAIDKRDEVRCRRCDSHAYSAARACGIYEGALRASVLALKREPNLSRRVTELLLQTQTRAPINAATCVVPVPLHPRREKTRGFNQASILARALSQDTGLRLDEVSLVRTHHADRHRAGMDGKSRRESVEHAFEVLQPRPIAGEKVLLIDDVFTTGATVSACAEALVAAGAAKVFVLTLARASHY